MSKQLVILSVIVLILAGWALVTAVAMPAKDSNGGEKLKQSAYMGSGSGMSSVGGNSQVGAAVTIFSDNVGASVKIK